jgi:hypothetical protein
MKIEYTRQAAPDTGGGFIGGFTKPAVVTQTKVEELPDKDDAGKKTPVPDGAKQVDDSAPVHDWQ